MSYDSLQALVGTAIIDREFARRLLQQPAEAAAAFDLSPTEMEAVRTIQADSIQQFAAQLHHWLLQAPSKEVGLPRARYRYVDPLRRAGQRISDAPCLDGVGGSPSAAGRRRSTLPLRNMASADARQASG